MRSARTWSVPLALGAALGLAASAAGSAIVKPSGSSDALSHRAWYPGYNSYWVDSGASSNLTAYMDTSGDFGPDRWWDVPVFEFPLSGVTSNTATLNLHVSAAGTGTMQVRYAGGDDNGVIEAGDWLNAGTLRGTFDGTATGWHSFDVSAQLGNALAGGHNWIVFTVRPSDQRLSTTISASEGGSLSPFIEVIPEPVSLFCLAASLPLIALLRRRTD